MIRSLLFFLWLPAMIPHPQPSPNEKVFQQLQGLQGTWLMKTTKGYVGETWVKTNGTLLENKGFTVKGTDTVVTETVALQLTDKQIAYTSTVPNQNNMRPVNFILTSSNNNLFIFENPAHDFPKRIAYHLIGRDSLFAYIDGGSLQPGKRQTFRYSKAK